MRAAAAAAAGRMVVPRTMRGRKRPRGGRLSSSSSSGGDGGVEVHAPVGMGIERPTPLLLLQGEGRTAECWRPFLSFFTQRGCTLGTIPSLHDDKLPSPSSIIDAYDARLSAAVQAMGMGPPVIVAQGISGLLVQKYLESRAAAGLVLLDPWSPAPAAVALRCLRALGMKGDDASGDLQQVEVSSAFRRLLQQDTAAWGFFPPASVEGRCFFPLLAIRAAALPSNALRLEPHPVPLLLLHSAAVAGGRHPWLTREDIEATAAFHELEAAQGDVRELEEGDDGPLQVAKAVYEWYDERF